MTEQQEIPVYLTVSRIAYLMALIEYDIEMNGEWPEALETESDLDFALIAAEVEA